MTINDMKLGWFIGNFNPSAYNTNNVEIAIKKYTKGSVEKSHYHKKSTEITTIISGHVLMNNIEYKTDDIITINPNTSTDFIVLEDTTTCVVKIPSNIDDKYQNDILYISHRGNIANENVDENNPNKIEKVLFMGYDCEVDLHLYNGELYLGHDTPEYKIPHSFIEKNKNKLWIHAKNIEALEYLNNLDNTYNYFWHDKDLYTITSKNFIWGNINSPFIKNSICVLPECFNTVISNISLYQGICSNNIEYYKNIIYTI